MTPTQRSLAYLRKQGYVCDIVERYNSFSKTRKDLFGMFDIIAIHPEAKGVLGVQTTSTGNMTARVKKCQANEHLPLWLLTGNEAVVHGWALRGGKGKRKTYQLKEMYLMP